MSDDEVRDLTDRVRALERRLDGEPLPPAAGSEFWVLDGLAARELDAVTYAGTASLAGGPSVRWQLTRDSTGLVQEDWSERAATIAALGHPVRLRILQRVATGAATTAAALAAADDLGSTGQIYHHLRQLVATGWLQASVRGQHVVPPERVIPLLTVLSAGR